MFEINFIRKILKDYVDQGIKQFVIYPFGVNGVNVRNVLQDCYGLQPCFIVDNEFCKYNPNIVNHDTLRNVYQKEMYIILTVENKDVNLEVLKKISDFVPEENIINIYENKYIEDNSQSKKENVGIKKYTGEGFLLCDFLPWLYTANKGVGQSGKIKVRIAHSSVNNWNAISRIYQAFVQDPLFEVCLIITAVNFTEKAVQQAQKKGYNHVVWESYHIQMDRPDILILTNIGDKIVSEGISCREYAKFVVVAYMQLIPYNWDSITQFWEFIEKGYGKHRPDYYLFDSLLYKELRQLQYAHENIIEMGNTKFDGIYQAMQNGEYPEQWKKLKGKPVVLWATSHGVYNREVTPNITFDLYAKGIFEYLENHQEVGLIFRPHKVFIAEMLESGFWTKEDFQQLKRYCDDSANIIFDDFDTYNTSLFVADGILTDAYCGIICSALPTLKPICASYRSKKDLPRYKNLLNCCYAAYDNEDIAAFFEMIKTGQDTMLDLRIKASGEYVKHFDGKNGERMKKFVKNKILEMQEYAVDAI